MAGGVLCVLFTDLVGSTELMTRLGYAERAREFLDRALAVATDLGLVSVERRARAALLEAAP